MRGIPTRVRARGGEGGGGPYSQTIIKVGLRGSFMSRDCGRSINRFSSSPGWMSIPIMTVTVFMTKNAWVNAFRDFRSDGHPT